MREKVLQKKRLKSILMKFYSGFSLKNDIHFFDKYLNTSEYCVAGFSLWSN